MKNLNNVLRNSDAEVRVKIHVKMYKKYGNICQMVVNMCEWQHLFFLFIQLMNCSIHSQNFFLNQFHIIKKTNLQFRFHHRFNTIIIYNMNPTWNKYHNNQMSIIIYLNNLHLILLTITRSLNKLKQLEHDFLISSETILITTIRAQLIWLDGQIILAVENLRSHHPSAN